MLRKSKSVQRLYVADALSAHSELVLTTQQAHYMRNVLRTRVQEAVLVFNGRDGEWRGIVKHIDKKQVVVQLQAQTRPQPTPTSASLSDIWLLVAPVKRARLDYLVQKATEMGASRVLLTITQHTQIGDIKLDRLRANAIEAAEQCGLLTIPDIEPPQKLAQLLAGWSSDRALIFCDETAPHDMSADRWATLPESCAVLIGPEGGFTAEERTALYAHPNVCGVSLGPRILRTDTAVVAALALVQNYMHTHARK